MGNMVRVNVKRIKSNLSAQSMEKVMKYALSPELMQDIGEDIHRLTTKNLKRGIITDGEVTGTVDPLSKEWIKRRKKLATVNETASWFAPAKSNLTFTGQLIESLSFKTQGTIVRIFFSNNKRVPYTNLNGTQGKSISNKKLSEYLAERYGSLIGLTDPMRKRVIRKVEKRLRDMLRALR